jgi:hypothetical protein
MKIRVKGAELKKVDIDFLSLVHRGANRAPFKVIKAEDGAIAALQEKTGLIGSVQKFFHIAEPAAQVVAVFVQKEALAKAAPNLADAGFDLNNHEVQEDCIVFKQAGFDEAEQVIILKSEGTIAFAVSGVEPYADVFCGNLSFDPSVADTGFYPGLNEAMKAMQMSMNVAKTDSGEVLKAFHSYAAQIKKAIPESVFKFESLQRGFGGATTGDSSEIAKAATALVDTIIKDAKDGDAKVKDEADKTAASSETGENENATQSSELPGDKDDAPDDEASRKAKLAKTTGDESMSKTAEQIAVEKAAADKAAAATVKKSVRPIVFKNADGSEYHQAVSPEGLVMKYTAGAKIPEGHTTMTEPWDQDGALGGTNNGNGQGQGKAQADEDANNEVRNTGAGGDRGNMDGDSPVGSIKKEDLDALLKAVGDLPALVAGIAKSVGEQGETLKTMTGRLAAVEKTATTAVQKAEKTVVHVGTDYDSAFENLGGGRRRGSVEKADARTPEMIRKAEYPDSLWGKTLGIIEQHRVGEGE